MNSESQLFNILFYVVSVAYAIYGLGIFSLSYVYFLGITAQPVEIWLVRGMTVLGLGMILSFPLSIKLKKISLAAGTRVLVYTFILFLFSLVYILNIL